MIINLCVDSLREHIVIKAISPRASPPPHSMEAITHPIPSHPILLSERGIPNFEIAAAFPTDTGTENPYIGAWLYLGAHLNEITLMQPFHKFKPLSVTARPLRAGWRARAPNSWALNRLSP